MKKLNLCFVLSLCSFISFSQVGIDTTSPEGALDIASTTEGVLVPRVSLNDLFVQAPIVNPNGSPSLADGTMVYNTTNVGNVSEGFYYWNSNRWNGIGKNDVPLNFTSIAVPSPAGINNNFDIFLSATNADKNVFRIEHSGAEIGGIVDGVHGQIIYVYNGDPINDLKLLADVNSTSAPATKFAISNDLILTPGSATLMFYDGAYLQRWIVIRGT